MSAIEGITGLVVLTVSFVDPDPYRTMMLLLEGRTSGAGIRGMVQLDRELVDI
jgi:hypothetical protein